MRSFNLLTFVCAVAAACAIWCLAASCTPKPQPEAPGTAQQEPGGDGDNNNGNGAAGEQGNTPNPEDTMTINITAGGKTFTAEIEGSATGKAFIAKLPLTLNMSDLNGNEKYCYGVELPRADRRYDDIAAGDLMLYSGSCVVLFYAGAGGYSYTRIGKLTSTAGLKDALGPGSVTVTFAKP